jgi:hypothetical protein
MAAMAGLVGSLLMHICTNYETIMNGTQPDGKFMMTEGNCSVTQVIIWSLGVIIS